MLVSSGPEVSPGWAFLGCTTRRTSGTRRSGPATRAATVRPRASRVPGSGRRLPAGVPQRRPRHRRGPRRRHRDPVDGRGSGPPARDHRRVLFRSLHRQPGPDSARTATGGRDDRLLVTGSFRSRLDALTVFSLGEHVLHPICPILHRSGENAVLRGSGAVRAARLPDRPQSLSCHVERVYRLTERACAPVSRENIA